MTLTRAITVYFIKGVLAAGLILGLAACDQHKAEREQAQTELNQQQSEHSHVQRQLEQAHADLAQTEHAHAEQQERVSALKSEQVQRSARLTEYLGVHKAAALALAASGAGAITALDDETRQSVDRELGQGASGMAVMAGIVGAGYCIFNMGECAEVGSYLASYSMERSANHEHLQQVQALSQQLAQSRAGHQETVQTLVQRLDTSRAAMSDGESRIAQLRCKGPLC
ncbi:hypothetical protein [Rhodoferax antarcticus]|uniref:hypothetical protein n=1 Tax=Rhodoferax antarcticus TaxID=81479 RepID=UPI002225516B|nr:hypothetical protein [Rhodoferax antarcticus]MCW2314357.1 septal ring factor EnvC (AmiA/AmiB activator) [Rhodoferax antarcticus]